MMNSQQQEAIIKSIDNNIVLMAGAGSGKTKTLIKRTEYLIRDFGVEPSQIMLVTFTNKAANEILDRMSKVSDKSSEMWIGTFHKICTRILRKFGSAIGIKYFSIIDGKEQKKIITDIIKAKGMSADKLTVNGILAKISGVKALLINKKTLEESEDFDDEFKDIYNTYVKKCWVNKTFDFDDLITYTVVLLSGYKYVANWIHTNIKYVMADESQDISTAQFVLLKLLTGDNNIMIVGDTSQSIYGFRNAQPKYLDNFAASTPNTIKLYLEQNYRSTGNIIKAATEVVKHNRFGSPVNMTTTNDDGEKIKVFQTDDQNTEARWISQKIPYLRQLNNGKWSDFAIIYRTNFQSRNIEDALTDMGIPYTVFGSISFYSRTEVKDLLAYCKIVVNPMDESSFERVMGTVKGIGKKTIESIVNTAKTNKVEYRIALQNYADTQAKGSKQMALYDQLKVLNMDINNISDMVDIVDEVFLETDYKSKLAEIGTDEAMDKIEIMNEFREMIIQADTRRKKEGNTFAGMLDDISLLGDTKGEEKANTDSVKLMTAHSSKGLEFNTVFIAGSSEYCFPYYKAIYSQKEEAIEEERRLYYVAMTRAEKELYLTCPRRMMEGNGNFNNYKISRFITEIPDEYKEDIFI